MDSGTLLYVGLTFLAFGLVLLVLWVSIRTHPNALVKMSVIVGVLGLFLSLGSGIVAHADASKANRPTAGPSKGPIMEDYHAHGPAVGLDRFLTRVIGPDWRADIERAVPGAPEQMAQDTGTFFDTDLPALLAWRFGAEDARRITQPVLHIGGSESGRWFAEVRDLMLAWLPQADDVVLAGAHHSLALTHPAEVAAAVVAFLRRHPIPG